MVDTEFFEDFFADFFADFFGLQAFLAVVFFLLADAFFAEIFRFEVFFAITTFLVAAGAAGVSPVSCLSFHRCWQA
jgi:hypothetical protein